MIFHISHSSIAIPEELRNSILLCEDELAAEILLITDMYTDDLFSYNKATQDKALVFPISRIIVDPERFYDEEKETMASVGMGVIYTKTTSGKMLRDAPLI